MVTTLRDRAKALIRWIDRATTIVAAGLLCALVIITIVAVVFRYGGAPLTWSTEVQQIMFIWLTFLGAAVAMARNEHSGFTGVITRLPRKVRFFLVAVSAVAVFTFLGVCLWTGIAVLPQLFGQTSPTLGVSVAWSYAALPVGMLLIAVQFLGIAAIDPVETERLLRESEGVPI